MRNVGGSKGEERISAGYAFFDTKEISLAAPAAALPLQELSWSAEAAAFALLDLS